MPTRATDSDALIVVDLQNDFLPGGALAVRDGDRVVPVINRLAARFRHVVLTQDWHPAGHLSFASSHPGRRPFERVALPYGDQVLWPDHCIQATPGAALASGLDVPHAELILRKGYRAHIDSYSAFTEADGRTSTGLAGYLRQRGFNRVVLCGLATDFCVRFTAIDGRGEGFAVGVVEDACRGIDADGSVAAAWTAMAEAGIERWRAADLLD